MGLSDSYPTCFLFVGWFVARIVRRIVTNLLAAVGVDQVAERVGLANVLGQQQISGPIGLIVYALIFLPVIIGAVEALALQALPSQSVTC